MFNILNDPRKAIIWAYNLQYNSSTYCMQSKACAPRNRSTDLAIRGVTAGHIISIVESQPAEYKGWIKECYGSKFSEKEKKALHDIIFMGVLSKTPRRYGQKTLKKIEKLISLAIFEGSNFSNYSIRKKCALLNISIYNDLCIEKRLPQINELLDLYKKSPDILKKNEALFKEPDELKKILMKDKLYFHFDNWNKSYKKHYLNITSQLANIEDFVLEKVSSFLSEYNYKKY